VLLLGFTIIVTVPWLWCLVHIFGLPGRDLNVASEDTQTHATRTLVRRVEPRAEQIELHIASKRTITLPKEAEETWGAFVPMTEPPRGVLYHVAIPSVGRQTPEYVSLVEHHSAPRKTHERPSSLGTSRRPSPRSTRRSSRGSVRLTASHSTRTLLTASHSIKTLLTACSS
jgi:hypothetical protein